VASRKGSQQSTVSLVVSQGTEQRLTDLNLAKFKTSSSDLENLKKSSELENPNASSSSELEKLNSKERGLPSELYKLRGDDLELVKRPNKFGPIVGADQNSNCKSADNCAECVL